MPVTRRTTPAAPEFRDLSQESTAQIVKEGARLYVTAMQIRLAEQQLQLGHLTLLRILWVQDGLSQRELSKLAGVAEPTTAVALRAMEELDYVVRERRDENRKNVFVLLRPKGRRLRRSVEPIAIDINEEAVAGMTKSEVRNARAHLLQIIANLRQHIQEHRAPRGTTVDKAPRKAAST